MLSGRVCFKYLLFVFVIIGLTGCANLDQNWTLQKQRGDLQYFTRQSPNPSLPEFKAFITVQAPLSEVMMLMTDFSRHPEWVYGCEESTVISLEGYTEAYLYQVTRLPLIKNRDMLVHATTQNDGNGSIRIHIQAAPHYCDNSDDAECVAIRASHYVRITEVEGEFVLTRLDSRTTRIEWTQFVDPAGMLPHWLFRTAMSQVPIKSLQQLKTLVEADGI